MHCDTLWYHANLITVDGPGLGVIEDGVIAATDGRIVHVGAVAGIDRPIICSRPSASTVAGAGSAPA